MVHKTGVYCFFNTINGKRYVGTASISLRSRRKQHEASLARGTHWNRHLQGAWKKYGSQAFKFVVLVRCPPEECVRKEQEWIDRLKAANPRFGYNLSPTAGSILGIKQTEEDKVKKSRARKQWASENREEAMPMWKKSVTRMHEVNASRGPTEKQRLARRKNMLRVQKLRTQSQRLEKLSRQMTGIDGRSLAHLMKLKACGIRLGKSNRGKTKGFLSALGGAKRG